MSFNFHTKSPTPAYPSGGKLPLLHSYEPAEYAHIRGEGTPRRRIGVEQPATECMLGAEYSNIWSMFEYAAKKYPDNDCFGKRVPAAKGPFQWMKYSEAYEAAKTAGSGLRALGLQPGDCLGLYAPNSEEWAFASLGAYSQSITIVPLYDTLGDDAVRYEIEHAELKLVVCAQKNLHAVAAVKDKIPTLKTIVQVENRPFPPSPYP
jgi:long-chain acyl-CoA synthetase